MEINEIETKNNTQRTNKTKSWFFEKIIKIDKPLAHLSKLGEKKLKSVKSEMQKGRQQTPQKSRES
jgi:hypothetical protein